MGISGVENTSSLQGHIAPVHFVVCSCLAYCYGWLDGRVEPTLASAPTIYCLTIHGGGKPLYYLTVDIKVLAGRQYAHGMNTLLYLAWRQTNAGFN